MSKLRNINEESFKEINIISNKFMVILKYFIYLIALKKLKLIYFFRKGFFRLKIDHQKIDIKK